MLSLYGVVLSLISVTLSSCVSTEVLDPVEPGELRTAYERTILSYLSEDPLRAVQAIDYYSRESDLFEPDEISVYLQRAIDIIREQLSAFVAQEMYTEALRMFVSLEAIDALENDVSENISALENIEWSRDTLLNSLLNQQIDNNLVVPALHSFNRITDTDTLSADRTTALSELARTHNHRNALARLAALNGSRTTERNAPLNLEEMLNGLVTIWVDRGYRIEGGIGIPERVIGSGFFIDTHGYLLTNYHIISSEVDSDYEGYSRLFLQVPALSHQRLPARVVGYDPLLDIALLKAEWSPPYIFGIEEQKSDIAYGTKIFALGSPVGLQSSITSGIVSSPSRKFLQIGETLQIDVPVNPGNSGGPLIEERGSLLGVVFAGIQQLDGINFAIPASWVWNIIPQLYTPGEVEHSWLGAALFESPNALEVQYVLPGSPADTLGLRKGTIIKKIAHLTPQKIIEAQEALVDYRPNTLIEMAWEDNGTPKSGVVKLGTRPRNPIEEALQIQEIDSLFAPLFGLEVRMTNRNLPPHEYIIDRVYAGGIADQLDIKKDDSFRLFEWKVDEERRLISMRISIKKRTNSFSDSGVQISSFLEQPNFI